MLEVLIAPRPIPLFVTPADAHLRRALLLIETRATELRDGQLSLAAQEIRAFLFAQRQAMEAGNG
jgi:hypothetical protein